MLISFTRIILFSDSLKWRECKRLPVDMEDAQAVWLGDNLYVGGGMTTGTQIDAARVCIYNYANDTWKEASTPVYRFALIIYHSQLILVGGREYVCNGTAAGPVTNELWTLDEYDQWSKTIPPMLTKRWGASAVGNADNILVAGGKDDKCNETDTVEVYNGHYQWTKAACMPNPSYDMKCALLNGIWYLMGGPKQGKKVYCVSVDSLIASCQSGDELPAESLWKRLTDVFWEQSSIGIFEKRLIAIGGRRQDALFRINLSSSIYVYSPHTYSWRYVGNLPVKIHSTCIATLNNDGVLIIIGGVSIVNEEIGGVRTSIVKREAHVFATRLNGKNKPHTKCAMHGVYGHGLISR